MRFAEGVWLIRRALPAWRRRSSADIPKDDLQHTFPEFGPYFGQCRFTGCSHRSETGCAVREAVEAGTISKTRYASYLAMYEEASARKEWEK